MVTQIYTAPLKVHYNAQLGVGSGVSSAKRTLDTATEDNPNGNNAPIAAAVQEQGSTGVISIQSILTDFQSTMDALGVTPEVRDQVTPYLQVVAHQATNDQPVTGLMKQNLRGAAGTLDTYISGALGQNSSVVREWVDALLTQHIDYHSDSPIALGAGFSNKIFTTEQSPFAAAGSAAQVFPLDNTTTLSPGDHEMARQALSEARAQQKSGNYEAAQGLYETALGKIDGRTQNPALEGKAWLQLGQCREQTGDTTGAQSAYLQASDRMAQSSDPLQQARSSTAMGNFHARQGQWSEAQSAFESALGQAAQAGNTPAQVASLQRLSRLAMQQGDTDTAQSHLTAALDLAQQANAAQTPDLLRGLGDIARQTGTPADAFSYYKQSLASAQQQGNTSSAQQTLQQLAGLYLDNNKPAKAYALLQKVFAG